VLNLVTGMPGNGKTLWTIVHVEALRKESGRSVFYNGIAELKLPWTLIPDEDVSRWPELVSDGSIVVIDEAQALYRPRTFGSVVPPYVSALETHRHRGLDIFFLTQNPMLVDTNVRRLVGVHRHVVRPFGLGRAVVHKWENQVKENPERPSSRVGSDSTEFTFPKDAFGLYKSAEIHTHKRSIPRRVWWFLLLLALSVVAIYFVVQRVSDRVASSKSEKKSPVAALAAGSAPPVSVGAKSQPSFLDTGIGFLVSGLARGARNRSLPITKASRNVSPSAYRTETINRERTAVRAAIGEGSAEIVTIAASDVNTRQSRRSTGPRDRARPLRRRQNSIAESRSTGKTGPRIVDGNVRAAATRSSGTAPLRRGPGIGGKRRR